MIYGVRQSLDSEPIRGERFILVDGTVLSRDVPYCSIALQQRETYSPVVLGQNGEDQALQREVALKNPGLLPKPFGHTLHPVRLPWRS